MMKTVPDTTGGFTLVELVVTISILTIVLSIAAYTFKDVLWRNQVTAAANDFVSTLGFARSEAVTRGQTVTLCRSLNVTSDDAPSTPVPSCSTASGAGWETGYIVFVDSDADGTRDAKEDLLRVMAGPKSGVTIENEKNSETVAPFKDRISYSSLGFLATDIANNIVAHDKDDPETTGNDLLTFSFNGETSLFIEFVKTGRFRVFKP